MTQIAPRRARVAEAAIAGVLSIATSAWAADEPAAPTSAPSDAATVKDMAAEIKSLRARVEQLESQQARREAADHHHAKEVVDSTVDAVLQDADRRSNLLDLEGFTAGYTSDKGFVLRSGDGNFELHPYIQFLFRNVTNFREDSKADGSDDLQNGFEVRRLKLGFDGTLWGPDFKYLFLWATDRKTGNLILEEAWGTYKLGNFGLGEPVSIQAGQFKNYFAHEAMASSRRVFAAERTLLNNLFTGGDDFIQGVGLIYNEGKKGGPLRVGVVVNDGSNDFDRNFQDFPTGKWNYGVAARVEYKAFGDWSNYDDFTALNLKKPLLVFGGALDYSEAGDFAQFRQTVDVQYKADRVALYAAYLGRELRHAGVGGGGTGTPSPATAGIDNYYDYGFVGKAGYLFAAKWELFGQYSYTQLELGEFTASSETTIHEITSGVNWYIQGHNAKFTIDLTWLPNGSPVSDDGAGILAQPNGNNEFVLRTQFQLLL
jgi:hypothetical protein